MYLYWLRLRRGNQRPLIQHGGNRKMATHRKNPKDGLGLGASSPERLALIERLIASTTPVKISLTLRPGR